MNSLKSSTAAYVFWPSAPLTRSLVLNTLLQLPTPLGLILKGPPLPTFPKETKLLQWTTYDDLSHTLTLSQSTSVLSSSYTIRKSLIRKHFLARTISVYLKKNPTSCLQEGVGSPRTWELEIAWAEELEERWFDELWDLGAEIDKSEGKWWILKPGMADRGNGIRLFDSREGLQRIFEAFEDDEEDDDDDLAVVGGEKKDNDKGDTGVITSQLRHFVIQEYISNPLLFDPTQAEVSLTQTPEPPRLPQPRDPSNLKGHKFHLRAYCLASGAIKVYLYTHVLALFSSVPYQHPHPIQKKEEEIDLTPHLTNTCLQPGYSEEHVRTLDELVGCQILSLPQEDQDEEETNIFTKEDVEGIKDQMAEILAETFRAALEGPVHFQPLPNAFELFGVDFLISHPPPPSSSCPSLSQKHTKFRVTILELNAEPAIEMTGPRLRWVLQGLFKGIGEVCIAPFFAGKNEQVKGEGEERWADGEVRHGMIKCLQVEVRGPGGWCTR